MKTMKKENLTMDFLKGNTIVFDGKYSYKDVRDFLEQQGFNNLGWLNYGILNLPKGEWKEQGSNFDSTEVIMVDYKNKQFYSVSYEEEVL